jgi:hypothetical protein
MALVYPRPGAPPVTPSSAEPQARPSDEPAASRARRAAHVSEAAAGAGA